MSGAAFGEIVAEYLEGMEQWTGSLAVVAGASGGIGSELVCKLVKLGVNVIGLGRRADVLANLKQSLTEEAGSFHFKECDLRQEQDIVDAFEWIDETFGGISILVNAAGVLRPTSMLDGDYVMWKETVAVNVVALCICSRQAVRSMRKHDIEGHIVHVASTAGHDITHAPFTNTILNVYAPSKAAVVALAETLRKELKRENIRIKVSTISPGVATSELYKDISGDEMAEVENVPKLQCADIANSIIYTLATPPGVQVMDLMISALEA